MLGCFLNSFHFLWAILSTSTVLRGILTESAARVECEPAPPEHEEADDGVRGTPHWGVALDVPTSETGTHHLGGSKC